MSVAKAARMRITIMTIDVRIPTSFTPEATKTSGVNILALHFETQEKGQ